MVHSIQNRLSAILIISFIFLIITPQVNPFSKVTQIENIESPYSSREFSMSPFGVEEGYILLYGKPFRILGFNYLPSDSHWKPLKEYNWSKVRFELSLGRELGANTVRVFIDYEYAVGNPNYSKDIFTYYHVDQEYLNTFKKLLNICNELGYKVIVTLDPGYWEFYKPQNTWVIMKFLEEFITPFIDDRTIIAWDLMNEPDINWNMPGAPSIEEHLELLMNMALKIRELDKLHLITIGWGRLENAKRLADYVDFISFHYYGTNITQEWDDIHDVGGLVKSIRELRYYGKPLVLSEFGWPVVQDLGWDESLQAKIYDSILHNLLEYEPVAGVLFWTLVDLTEARFGVYSIGYSPRPSAAIINEYFHMDSILHFYNQHYDLFEIVYETIKSPNSDPRLLGLGVDYIAFIDDGNRTLGFIDIGKSELAGLRRNGIEKSIFAGLVISYYYQNCIIRYQLEQGRY